MNAALALFVIADVAILLSAVVTIAAGWRAYRAQSRSLPEFWLAMEHVTARRIGQVPARLLVGEPKTFGAIVLMSMRGRSLRPGSFAYASRSQIGMVIAVVLGLVILEAALGGLLIPWMWLKLALLIVSTYAGLWILGIYFSLRTYPHLITDEGLLVRYGVLADAWIPWSELSEISLLRASAPGGQDGLVGQGSTAMFSVGGKTDILVRRKTPGYVSGFLRRRSGIENIQLSADRPDVMVAAAEHALERARRHND